MDGLTVETNPTHMFLLNDEQWETFWTNLEREVAPFLED